jgi:hypothetical protein
MASQTSCGTKVDTSSCGIPLSLSRLRGLNSTPTAGPGFNAHEESSAPRFKGESEGGWEGEMGGAWYRRVSEREHD